MTAIEPDNTKVINLAGEPVTLIKRNDGFCESRCTNVIVDHHLRKLTCRECGADVGVFAWVMRMAIEESSLMARIAGLKMQMEAMSKHVEELKGEEQRVKARIRSAKESLIRAAGV